MRGLCSSRDTSMNLLFNLIGQLRVGNRPGRIEREPESVAKNRTTG